MSNGTHAVNTTGVLAAYSRSIIGAMPPANHPVNCKHECPYGRDKAFCFPCYKKILEEMRRRR